MASSAKMRILVYFYSLFLLAVIWLGVFYRPANLVSRPAPQNAGAVEVERE